MIIIPMWIYEGYGIYLFLSTKNGGKMLINTVGELQRLTEMQEHGRYLYLHLLSQVKYLVCRLFC